MKDVYIVAATRTPIGAFGGSLSTFTAPQLGAIVIKGALERSGVKPEWVQEVFMGNVLSAGLGQAPARQAALYAGLPKSVPCTTVNKVCASGMKAISLAAMSIASGQIDIAVAGGMESMSNVPHYLEKSRNGFKLGHAQLTDGLIKDGLWDVYNNYHMGNAAELCAKEMNISRESQDEYAIESYKRAAKATSEGKFNNEIVAIEVTDKKGNKTLITEDEEHKAVNFEKVKTLKPVFQKDGTVTAANASTLNDGASALILVSEEKLKEYGLKAIGKIKGFADYAQEPEWFTTAPAKALPKAIALAGLKADDIDYYEINEAFSVVSLANNQLLNLNSEKVNINGGAVAIGHPLGSSGSRIVVTLLNVLKQNNAKIGAAGICNGGGGASAMVIESL
jgi:acetyl-CoA C-acetyltransferase